jgi:hypothetical protein
MFIYMLPPIDHGFGLLSSCEDVIRKIDHNGMDSGIYGIPVLASRLYKALDEAKLKGWEGDFTIKPKVLVLPPCGDDFSLTLAFIWKQSNNGSVFIASEDGIPWLAQYFVE